MNLNDENNGLDVHNLDNDDNTLLINEGNAPDIIQDDMFDGVISVSTGSQNPLKTTEDNLNGELNTNNSQKTGDNGDNGNEGDNKNVDDKGSESTNKDEGSGDDNKGDDGDNKIDTSKYTPSALYALALKEEGLGFLGEDDIKPDMKPEDLVGVLKNKTLEFANNYVNSKIEEELKQTGQYAKYLKLLIDSNGEVKDDLKPAVLAEQYANFDLESDNVTENDLKSMVLSMLKLQGTDQNIASDYVNRLSKDELIEKSKLSKQYHKSFIDKTIKQIELDREQKIKDEQQKQLQFVNSLKSTLEQSKDLNGLPISNDEKQKILSNIIERDQLVNVFNPNTGEYERREMSIFDIEMHNAVNDPKKLLILSKLIANDWNFESVKEDAKTNVSSQIYTALNKQNSQNSNNTQNPGSNEFYDEYFGSEYNEEEEDYIGTPQQTMIRI